MGSSASRASIGPDPVPVSLTLCVVTSVEVDGRNVLCRAGGTALHAVLALPHGDDPAPGDTVLVGRADDGVAYVVGVLSPRAPDGLRVRRDPETNRTVVDVPDGDLVLRAPGRVLVEGADGVTLRAGDGDAQARVTLDRTSLRAEVARVGIEAVEALAKVALARVDAGVVTVTASRIAQTAEVIETRAQRLFERAHASYREVESLAQTRAAQVRVIAREAIQLRGKRALIKADEDVKVKAAKIYLA